MILIFADLRRDELVNLPAELTVFLFSLGGLEQHGAHLPLGTKWFLAEQSIRIIADSLQHKMPQWNFVLMPSFPLTVDTVTTKIAFPMRGHIVRDVLVDYCNSLKQLGFSKFAVLTEHLTPRQLSAIEDAGRIISQKKHIFSGTKSQFISISSIDVNSSEVMSSPMIANPKEHAGKIQTGLMLAFRNQRVSKDYVSLPDLPAQKQNASRLLSYYRHELDGYWGKPREANPEIEKQALIERLDKTTTTLKAVFETGQGSGLYHSGYRYFFFNGSFFKAYLMGVVFFIMMIIWSAWSLKDIFEP